LFKTIQELFKQLKSEGSVLKFPYLHFYKKKIA